MFAIKSNIFPELSRVSLCIKNSSAFKPVLRAFNAVQIDYILFECNIETYQFMISMVNKISQLTAFNSASCI